MRLYEVNEMLSDVVESLVESKRLKKSLAAVAVQIVYEYPNWGQEHISDMYDISDDLGFSYDDLEDAVYAADKLKKKERLTYKGAISALQRGKY